MILSYSLVYLKIGFTQIGFLSATGFITNHQRFFLVGLTGNAT